MASDEEHQRPVRIALPASVLRRLDMVTERRIGGYESRSEFIREAVEQLLDLTLEGTGDRGEVLESRSPSTFEYVSPLSLDPPPGSDPDRMLWNRRYDWGGDRPPAPLREGVRRELASRSLEITRLPKPSPGFTWEASDEFEPPRRRVLFGLHNRDYPTLWALSYLCERCLSGPTKFKDFVDDATEEAWQFASILSELELPGRPKLTSLFPSNPMKRSASERGFRHFAVGGIRTPRDRDRRGRQVLSGPFFVWQIAAVHPNEAGDIEIAPTSYGRMLLEGLAGISLELPHKPEHAKRFLGFLEQEAHDDWTAFQRLIKVVREEPDRKTLIDRFDNEFKELEWTKAQRSTNTYGYVARAREWGLLEEKQIDRRYVATELGIELLGGKRTSSPKR